MAEKRMFIYMITNKANNKKYIGRTCSNIDTRLKQHFCDSKYIKNNCPLHKDMKKYNRTDFEIEVIYEFEEHSFYNADTIELDFINTYNTFYPNGYNKRRVKRNGR